MVHKLITTEDGSHSLYVEELNERYHSIHGAIQESKHVFIEAGLKQIASVRNFKEKKNEIAILEIGLGTGLNALLTMIENQQQKLAIDYTALEAYPVSADLIMALNYTDLLISSTNSKTMLQQFFDGIHLSEWGPTTEISEKFKLNKIKNTLQQVQFQSKFNLVYFDAFGPSVQPEMWTDEVFSKIRNAMAENGILVTYCAKGSVKRILKNIGFEIQSLQGPPGKREMIRAIKISHFAAEVR
jgi:tRNA U34 5-methylaminomethyl-2-thiouridine-forming methyltransferase MnmC